MNTIPTQTHTPGPYQIEDVSENITYPIYKVVKTGAGLRSVIASCADMALCDEHGGTVLANARLIAAAPDLLAALKNLVLSTDGIVSGPESDLCACCGKDYIDEQIRRAEAGEDCIYECTDQDCPRVQAFAAIAKATGSEVPA